MKAWLANNSISSQLEQEHIWIIDSVSIGQSIDRYGCFAETIKARRKQLQSKTKMTRMRVNAESNQNNLKIRNLQTIITP